MKFDYQLVLVCLWRGGKQHATNDEEEEGELDHIGGVLKWLPTLTTTAH